MPYWRIRGTVGEGGGRGLAEAAASLARHNMASWLTNNGEMLAATFGPRCTFYPVVAGSIVEGLLTLGSDVDLCAMVDGVGLVGDTSGAQDSYKRSISAMDKGLKEMGLGGVCRISRRIRHADDFLELHRCQE